MNMESPSSTSLRTGMRTGKLLLALLATTALQISHPFATVAYAQQNSVTYSIPAGSLGTVISGFGDSSNLQILYPADLVRGKTSPGLSGTMSRQEALSRLLTGTGLRYNFTNANTVTITDRISSAPNEATGANGAIVLDTITVSGGTSSIADIPFKTAGSSSYISAEQIQIVPPSSTGDILRNAPGVFSAGNRTGQALDVNIRGLQGMNRVATLVDGAQQSSSAYRGYKGMSSRTFVDPEFIGGIDIQKGPPTGAQGSGSMGGVVNMRTINADDIIIDGKSYGVKVKGGFSGNSIEPRSYYIPPNTEAPRFGGNDWLNGNSNIASVALAAKNENYELVGAFASRRNGNYFAGTKGEKQVKRFTFGGRYNWGPMSAYKPGSEIFNTSQDTKSVLLKGKFNFEHDQSVELGYIRYDSTYGEEYGDMNNPVAIAGWPPYQANLSRTRSDMYTAKYTWNPEDNDLINLQANVWHTRLSDNWAAVEILTGVPGDTKTDTTGVEISNTSNIDTDYGTFDLRYGSTYSYEKTVQNPDTNIGMEGNRTVAAVFANADYKPVDWLTLTAGMRYQGYRTQDNSLNAPVEGLDGTRLTPLLGVTLEPLDGFQLFANYAQGWRPPSIRETIFKMPGLIEPNPFLRPERSENYEIGANYLGNDVLLDDDKLRFKLAFFDNNYDDYIVRSYGNRAGLPFPYRVYANIDGAKFRGVELSMSYDAGMFFTDANFNRYTNVEYCFAARAGESAKCGESTPPDDYQSVYVPPVYSGSVTLGARFLDESLTVGGRVNFVGERAIKRSGVGTVESEWRSYQVYDTFASYKLNDNFSFNASIENIFDLYYLDAMSEALTPSPGRTFRLSATARF
ncbi:TonB-dependent receptor [Pseudochrobactrum sp. sp1633]|uniref:TonB-dependent receptor n=1 Tax=Pseudochrobactrum sp. sp1633 TaxID=3036706 RepID=UPI0025A58BE3|nr:TonB-dependent receptor [Pseudochrobactrum sp. sp1633]MDM8346583.1 TonB-dependent receptor [Pseudochrobactrum sp. sp1633]HWD12643.1 TonB-dependent receptor [Pseudochrobactrum sp.]